MTLPLVDIAMLGIFTLFDWPISQLFSYSPRAKRSQKSRSFFFYFCCQIETEDIKDKLPKSGRIFFRLRQTFGTASGT